MRAIREDCVLVWVKRSVLASLVLFAATGVSPAQESKESKVLFEKTCSACHTSESATSARRTRDQWQSVIEEMVSQQQADIPDDAFTPILEYLVATYGKVNVNSAPAGEITQILGLTKPESESIVKFRKEHGKFEDFDALVKVPGIDAKKLEKSRDAIAF